MQQVLIHNITRLDTQPILARHCRSFFCRLRGLMFYPGLGLNEGLLMVQPRTDRLDAAIHMFFMNFDITTIWVSDDLRVVDTQLCRRWRPVYLPAEAARYVLETHASRKGDFRAGDQLSIEPC